MLQYLFVLVLCILVGQVQMAEASVGLSFGDGLAFFLCLGISIVGILACLGRYARRMSAEPY